MYQLQPLYETEHEQLLSQSAPPTALSSGRAFGSLALPAETAMKPFRKEVSLRRGRWHLRQQMTEGVESGFMFWMKDTIDIMGLYIKTGENDG